MPDCPTCTHFAPCIRAALGIEARRSQSASFAAKVNFTIVELARALQKNDSKALHAVAGISFVDGEEVLSTGRH